jgi:putative chitinase
MITLAQFQQMIPTNKEAAVWYPIAVDFFKKYDITTTNRIAGFMAQCAHESSDFRNLEENLNYGADRLVQVFPRYFGKGKRNPAEYARNPEKLANYVYMDEFRSKSGALGNVKPGDGWRFRGGGIKQLTGRNNYSVFAKDIGMAPEAAADYVRTKQGAFESACWFWKKNNVARFADADDIVGMSKKINGGTIGLDDRKNRYNRAKSILGGNASVNQQITDSVTQSNASKVLQKGSKGPEVVKLQKALNIPADGDFGLGTKIAVVNFQKRNGLTADGIAGPSTLTKLYK